MAFYLLGCFRTIDEIFLHQSLASGKTRWVCCFVGCLLSILTDGIGEGATLKRPPSKEHNHPVDAQSALEKKIYALKKITSEFNERTVPDFYEESL